MASDVGIALIAIGWAGTAVFMVVHIVGALIGAWGTMSVFWWVVLAFLLIQNLGAILA